MHRNVDPTDILLEGLTTEQIRALNQRVQHTEQAKLERSASSIDTATFLELHPEFADCDANSEELKRCLYARGQWTPEGTSPNVSQRGRVATKRSSSRRRRRVKIRKLSRGPSSAVLLAVLAPGVPICGQWKDTPFPRLVVQRNRSRYFLPLSSAELQLATVGAPGGIAPGKDSPSTATPRLCVR
jgi:hypothetical protein